MSDNSKIASAYVEFGGEVSKFNAALQHVHKKTVQAGGAIGSAGLSVGTKFASGLAAGLSGGAKFLVALGQITPLLQAAAGGIGKIVQAGSDLNETMTATEQTFGSATGVVTGAAQEMADKFGVAKQEFLEGAIAIGAMGQGMGKTEAESAAFGVQFAKLAADLSSFRNIPVKDALVAIQAGLSGEAEPLKRFGVLVDENAVKQAGWAMGLARVGDELNQQQKSVARAALIAQGFSKASGDLERTQDGLANRTRKAQGDIANSWAELGIALQPASTRIMESIAGGLGVAIDWLMDHKEDIAAWADEAASRFEGFAAYLWSWKDTAATAFEIVWAAAEWYRDTLIEAFGAVEPYIRGAVDAFGFLYRNGGAFLEDFGLTIEQWWLDFNAILDWLPNALATWGSWFVTNFPAIFVDAFTASLTAIRNFVSNAWELFKALQDWIASGFTAEFAADADFKDLLDGFERTSPEMPSIAGPDFDNSGTEARRKKIWDDVAESEAEILAPEEPAGGTYDFYDALDDFMADLFSGASGAVGSAGGGLLGKAGDAGAGGLLMPEDEKKKIDVLKVSDLGRKVQEAAGDQGEDKKQTKLLTQIKETLLVQERLAGQPRKAVAS